MSAPAILTRMAAAKAKMTGSVRRVPQAYYLRPADWAEFIATNPPTITALFRGQPRPELGFDGLPVRPSQGADGKGKSCLYSTAGTSVMVPDP